MTTAYYSAATDGIGFEGILNYVNMLYDGWFVNLFILFIAIVTTFVLSKSEWKMSGVIAFTAFLIFITAMIFSLFTQVNGYIIFVSIIGMALGVFLGVMTKNNR